MNRTVVGEWVLRAVATGIGALAGWVGVKYGEVAGGCVGLAGTAIATKTLPYLIPTKAKVEAGNQIPPMKLPSGLPNRKGMSGT